MNFYINSKNQLCFIIDRLSTHNYKIYIPGRGHSIKQLAGPPKYKVKDLVEAFSSKKKSGLELNGIDNTLEQVYKFLPPDKFINEEEYNKGGKSTDQDRLLLVRYHKAVTTLLNFLKEANAEQEVVDSSIEEQPSLAYNEELERVKKKIIFNKPGYLE